MTEEEKTEIEKSIGTAKAALEKIQESIREGIDPKCEVYKDLAEALDEIEGGVEEIQARDLEWYVEQNPEQVLDVAVPEETRLSLWRARLIDSAESNRLTVRELCEMLER